MEMEIILTKISEEIKAKTGSVEDRFIREETLVNGTEKYEVCWLQELQGSRVLHKGSIYIFLEEHYQKSKLR